jgi:hypothetical protein
VMAARKRGRASATGTGCGIDLIKRIKDRNEPVRMLDWSTQHTAKSIDIWNRLISNESVGEKIKDAGR